MGTYPPVGSLSNAVFPPTEMYALPDGNDDNSGLLGSPKLTLYEGVKALIEAGGGTLYFGDVNIGGPVTGQGLWLRSDYQQGSEHFLDIPGFLNLSAAPLHLVGVGKSLNYSPFAKAPMSRIGGSDCSQFKPGLWIVGSPAAKQLTIERMQVPFPGCKLGARLWVDFDREVGGAIKQINVLNATRTGTGVGASTVLTVDIDAVTPIVVRRASRTDNVTHLIIDNPGIAFTPWHPGQKIRFTSADSDFASGDYTIADMSNFENDNSEWWIEYAETDADVAEKDVSGCAVQSHGCADGELLWLTSNNGSFVTQQYLVISHTADTITLEDNFGDGDADEDDIGTIAHQERFYCRSTNVEFIGGEFSVSSGLQNAGATHGIDIGASLASWLKMTDVACSGAMVQDGPLYNDPRCFEAFYAYSGGDPRSGTAMFLDHCTSQNGGFFLEADSGGAENAIDSRYCLAEQSSGDSDRPGMRIWGNNATSVYVDRFENADGLGLSTPSVEVLGVPDYTAIVTRSGAVRGKVLGADVWDNPSVWHSTGGWPTPWQGGPALSGLQPGYFADGQLAAKHFGAQRAGGVYQARFKNIVLDYTDWGGDTGGQTYTGGFRAPDGSDTAVKIHTVGPNYVNIFPLSETGDTWEVGGRLVISGWVNAGTASDWQNELFRIVSAGVEFDTTVAGVTTVRVPHTNPGWQFVSYSLPVAACSDPTPQIQIMMFFQNGSDVYVADLDAHYVPLTDGGVAITDSDAAEYAGTRRSSPRYLPKGWAGTKETVPLIGHGGIGVGYPALFQVGVAPGQITLGGSFSPAKYMRVPMIASDGTVTYAFVELVNATVNT